MNDRMENNPKVGLNDNYDFRLQGKFRVYEVLPDGRKEILYGDNLVVTRARQILRDLMYNGDNSYIISYMKFGDKGHVGNDLLTPNPPKLSDVGLYEQNASLVYSKGVNRAKSGNTKIVYSCRLGQNEANLNGGKFAITEAGLFNSRNELFARKTFPVITKTPDRIYDFEWTIIF